RVACQIVQAVKRCVISQQQAQQNGQPLLAIELQPGPANTTTGNLVLPFGLLLDAGVTLQIDEQPAMPPARFRTCLPADCIVTL
ncbi:invasion associated locus B family protein, partial [Pseudomonas aeruginosa]|nr:invasion associated locus B family protein [Pseudomonas aeruginosa]